LTEFIQKTERKFTKWYTQTPRALFSIRTEIRKQFPIKICRISVNFYAIFH